MNYLNHRFSNTTSLLILLLLTLGTAWMFHFAAEVNQTAEGWYAFEESTQSSNSVPAQMHKKLPVVQGK